MSTSSTEMPPVATETPPATEMAPIQPTEIKEQTPLATETAPIQPTEIKEETPPIQPVETEIKKILVLKTGDDHVFEIEQSIAIQSRTIENLVEDDCVSSVIPIPNVDSVTLTKVIEYLKAHADPNASKDGLKEFDKKFLESVWDPELLAISELVLAANYLNIPGLLDLTCQFIADFIKDKSVEEVRELFKIVNDFTKEEEAKIRAEHSWAFE